MKRMKLTRQTGQAKPARKTRQTKSDRQTRQARQAKQIEEDNRISYIKNPMAINSYMCLTLSSISLFLFIIGMAIGIKTVGNIPIGGVAVCFSSLLFSVVGIRYGALSFKEIEKNYILARIGTSAGVLLTILWLVMILIGFRR